MIKKNLFVFLTVATMSLSSLTGCGNTKTNDDSVNTTSYETQSQESSLSKDIEDGYEDKGKAVFINIEDETYFEIMLP